MKNGGQEKGWEAYRCEVQTLTRPVWPERHVWLTDVAWQYGCVKRGWTLWILGFVLSCKDSEKHFFLFLRLRFQIRNETRLLEEGAVCSVSGFAELNWHWMNMIYNNRLSLLALVHTLCSSVIQTNCIWIKAVLLESGTQTTHESWFLGLTTNLGLSIIYLRTLRIEIYVLSCWFLLSTHAVLLSTTSFKRCPQRSHNSRVFLSEVVQQMLQKCLIKPVFLLIVE